MIGREFYNRIMDSIGKFKKMIADKLKFYDEEDGTAVQPVERKRKRGPVDVLTDQNVKLTRALQVGACVRIRVRVQE